MTAAAVHHTRRRANPWARLNAARTLERQGRAEEAIQAYQALASNQRVRAQVRLEATEGLARLGQAREAMETLLALARSRSLGSWARLKVARALAEMDRTEEAVRILRNLVQNRNLEAMHRVMAARDLARLNRGMATRMARTILAIALDRRASPGARLNASWTLVLLDQTRKAARAYQAIAGDRNQWPRDRLEAALVLEHLGWTREAAEAFLDILTTPYEDEAREAARALVRLGGVWTGRAIQVAVEHHSEKMASQIVSALRETPKGLQDVPLEDILKLVTSFPATWEEVIRVASQLNPPPGWLAVATSISSI